VGVHKGGHRWEGTWVKTADPPPTTGRAIPPGGVGVKRRREIYRIVAASLRDDHFSGPLKKIGDFPHFLACGTWDVGPRCAKWGFLIK
jgi:hypothetical protein